jgi:hypothetical protein
MIIHNFLLKLQPQYPMRMDANYARSSDPIAMFQDPGDPIPLEMRKGDPIILQSRDDQEHMQAPASNVDHREKEDEGYKSDQEDVASLSILSNDGSRDEIKMNPQT